MYPPPPLWARAPDLLVNEDFLSIPAGGANATVPLSTTFGRSLSNAAPQWVGRASGANGSYNWITGQTYHSGVLLLTTAASNGAQTAFGLDLSSDGDDGDWLTNPPGLVTGTGVYGFEFIVNIPSLATTGYTVGLFDRLLGSINNRVAIGVDTANGHSNWFALTEASDAGTITDSGIAATIGWHRFAAYRGWSSAGSPCWDFYVDNAWIARNTSNVPVSTMTIGGVVTARAALARSMLLDRARLWTDGANLVLGGSA
jgi:hypothetical protein